MPSGQVSSYSPDDKPDLRTLESDDADWPPYSNSITHEDARYLRKQASDLARSRQSASASPVKQRRELHPQPHVMDIVPDENPLGPTFLNHNQNITPVPTSATDNHFPGQAMHANHHIKGGTWKYGLCDFGDIGVCCTGFWCPCIIYGRTQYRLSQRSERRDPTNMLGFSIFNGSCAAFAVLCGCNLILAAIQRARVRQAYDISGGVGSDLARACCCCCCTLSQDEKEIKFRESNTRRPSMLSMEYVSPDGMNFSPSLR